jgi:hypothetical protein
MKRALAIAMLAALPACQGTRFDETEWRSNLQSRTNSVSLPKPKASLDPWSDRYVLEFLPDEGAPVRHALVLELDRTIRDGDGQDAADILKAWRYDSPSRSPLTPQNSRLKSGKISFHRLPEDHVNGTFDLLFESNVDGKLLWNELTEFQLSGSFRAILSPPRAR